MPTDKEKAQKFLERIAASNKLHDDWANKYKVNALEQYYEGFQWANMEDNPYILNLFYSTIETKMPSLIFDNPKFHLNPTSEAIASNPDEAFQIAANLEDTLNNWVQDIRNKLQDETDAAIFESWFRFGVIEIGYSSDWIDNPNVSLPALRSDISTSPSSVGARKNVISQPPQVPVNEKIYVRYIPATHFRVSVDNKRFLDQCDWVAYYEFIRTEDLLAAKNLKNLKDLNFSGFSSPESLAYSTMYNLAPNEQQILANGDYVLVWKIWHTRERKKYIIADAQQVLLYERKYKIFPFEELRFRKPLKGFYPKPPTFDWISPQNEINEQRESNRIHRRRFKRIYGLLQGAADFDEAQKLINGPDGGIIQINARGALEPIPNADLGASHNQSLGVTQSDFNIISATTAEQRGQAQEVTATQAFITNQRAQIRESREKVTIANFFCRIGKKILLFVKSNFVNPYVVQGSANEGEIPELINAESGSPPIRNIDPLSDLGGETFDFNVEVAIDSTSPVANEEELAKFLKFISLLTQFPQMALSPTIVREMAFRTGYRNERVIQQFQQMAQLQMVGQIVQAQQAGGSGAPQGGPTPGNLAQNTVSQATPPSVDQTREALAARGLQNDRLQ